MQYLCPTGYILGFPKHLRWRWFLPLALLAVAHPVMAADVQIAKNSQALLPVVVAKNASPEISALARKLAAGLEKITGETFAVQPGDGRTGLVLGTTEEWPGILPAVKEGSSPDLTREDYILRTEPDRVLLIGRTPLGAQNAVWDFFYRLGFRQYLPGPKWEMWPHTPDLSATLDVTGHPDYSMRKLRAGRTLTWPELAPAIEEWKERNRMVSGYTVAGSHTYGNIVEANPDFFQSHPDAISWSKEKHQPKLDASKPEVLEVVGQWARDYVKKNPESDTVPMDPSDGGGWPEDSPLGSPSNQAVTIANAAAKAVREIAPEKKVSIYAYNMHSPPPDIAVDKGVVASVATSFIKGNHSPLQLIEQWHQKGAEIGIREYLGVAVWDYGLPGKARAADPDYMARTIPEFYQAGARYWDSEASDAWGAYGPGYFLAARFLWDTQEAARKAGLLDEFYTRSFGKAAPIMKKFYETCLYKSGRITLSADLVGRMYRLLNEAHAQENDPAVTTRLLDLVLYTRYVELMLHLEESEKAAEKERIYSQIAALAQGNYDSMMFNRRAVMYEIPVRKFRLKKPELKDFTGPKMAGASPLSAEEIRALAKEGAKKYPPLPFEPASFSDDLRPAPYIARLRQKIRPVSLRGVNHLYLYNEGEQAEFTFTVTTGTIYQDRGDVKLLLFSNANALPGEPVDSATLPPDQMEHKVRLVSNFPGQHHLEIRDGGGGARIGWPEGQRGVFPVGAGENTTIIGAYPWAFYVPKGTRMVGGYSENNTGRLVTADGALVYDFSGMGKKADYFSAEVPPDADGTWWELEGSKGKKTLLTVPPYVARSPAELLIPEEKTPQSRR